MALEVADTAAPIRGGADDEQGAVFFVFFLWEAAEKAKEMYFCLTANGWDAFLAKYRTDKEQSAAGNSMLARFNCCDHFGSEDSVVSP